MKLSKNQVHIIAFVPFFSYLLKYSVVMFKLFAKYSYLMHRDINKVANMHPSIRKKSERDGSAMKTNIYFEILKIVYK